MVNGYQLSEDQYHLYGGIPSYTMDFVKTGQMANILQFHQILSLVLCRAQCALISRYCFHLLKELSIDYLGSPVLHLNISLKGFGYLELRNASPLIFCKDKTLIRSS